MCLKGQGGGNVAYRPARGATDWFSVAVCSDGSYGVEEGLISSFPVRSGGDSYEIVQDGPVNDFSRARIDASVKDLAEEKALVSELIS